MMIVVIIIIIVLIVTIIIMGQKCKWGFSGRRRSAEGDRKG
jgi:hypothetical protein